jgi:hypothetical protein
MDCRLRYHQLEGGRVNGKIFKTPCCEFCALSNVTSRQTPNFSLQLSPGLCDHKLTDDRGSLRTTAEGEVCQRDCGAARLDYGDDAVPHVPAVCYRLSVSIVKSMIYFCASTTQSNLLSSPSSCMTECR